MRAYLVEFMQGDSVRESRIVDAATPFQAATAAANREISYKADCSGAWLRVTVPGRKPFDFGFRNY